MSLFICDQICKKPTQLQIFQVEYQQSTYSNVFSSKVSTLYVTTFQSCSSTKCIPATEKLNCMQQGMQGFGKINYIDLQKPTKKVYRAETRTILYAMNRGIDYWIS